MTNRSFSVLAAVLVLVAATAASAGPRRDDRRGSPGAVYTMTNGATGNAVLVFDRASDGRLVASGHVATGGNGTGAGLGNQSGLVLSGNERWLLVVNAGSHSVSLLEVRPHGLRLVDVVDSGGLGPISVTEHHGVVYVLNAGTDSIAGFRLRHGRLRPIPGSLRGLSGTGVAPAQIGFSRDGDVLLVTEKATSQIVTYAVDRDGVPGHALVQPSSGATPFGFAVGRRDQVFVTEAAGAGNGSATSSYDVGEDGALTAISPSVPTNQAAACWAVLTPDGRYLYVTNAASGSISGFAVDFDGQIALVDDDGVTGVTGAGSTPLDMVITDNGRFLYVLNGGSHTIAGFRVGGDGSLMPLPGAVPVPGTANGLATR
ncbi:MAG: beta-propeller fold lactonase family protein [Vicinamibacterales bacterium]